MLLWHEIENTKFTLLFVIVTLHVPDCERADIVFTQTKWTDKQLMKWTFVWDIVAVEIIKVVHHSSLHYSFPC
jgi:hypothetical protein